MKKQSKIVSIGNSQGIRLPKLMLELSGIVKDVEIQVEAGEITITPAKNQNDGVETMQLSEKALTQDWDRPEEDEAWKDL